MRLTVALIGVVIAAVAAAAAGGEVAWLCVALSLACTAALRQRLVTLERERDALRRDALSDPVTGAANRRSLMSRAEYEIARHRRADQTFALVMLDLDGFKQLNDRFGHAAGDDLLRDVAGALRRAMRAQDTVARFGGDEFCVLAPETDEQRHRAPGRQGSPGGDGRQRGGGDGRRKRRGRAVPGGRDDRRPSSCTPPTSGCWRPSAAVPRAPAGPSAARPDATAV